MDPVRLELYRRQLLRYKEALEKLIEPRREGKSILQHELESVTQALDENLRFVNTRHEIEEHARFITSLDAVLRAIDN